LDDRDLPLTGDTAGCAVPTAEIERKVPSPIDGYLETLWNRYRNERSGAVADYIPELAKVNPDLFGICVATTQGRVYEVGDSQQEFTIQSISKPFTYGLALEDQGRVAVLAKIGVEPTGDAFNSISLERNTGRPLNPMINAGAIAASSLVAGHSPEDRLHRVLGVYSVYAGRQLSLDQDVYESERDTGHRNRAIGHMLRNFGILEGDPEPHLDLYFQQCSISVTCRDLSVMAATLANGGVNPVTSERALAADLVDSLLSVMSTCGMYDFAGEWVYSVGMPAKSGVGGGIIAVLPGQLGIGVFSPRLDPRGNSVRGVNVCKDLSHDFSLHFLRVPRAARAALHAEYRVSDVSSKRLRTEVERKDLDELGRRARVYELQGDLTFTSVEPVVDRLVDASPKIDFAIIDLRRVSAIEASAAGTLVELFLSYNESGKFVIFANVQGHSEFLRLLESKMTTPDLQSRLLTFTDLDPAIEWCENELLKVCAPVEDSVEPLTLAQHGLCRGLTAEEASYLEALVERKSWGGGQFIVHKGEAADEIFLLVQGAVSVVVDLPSGQLKRLSTISPGMAFGELAALQRGERSADVRADTAVVCYVLSSDTFDRLSETHPSIKLKLMHNLMHNLGLMVSRLNQEIAALSG
jgi:glutaminase